MSTADDDGERRTSRGFDRVVYFSDAVVAIAMTLLILPVVDAVAEAKVANELTGADFFSDNSDRLLAFAISFVVIAGFWVGHHQLFEGIKDYSSRLLWLNLLWLGTIAYLPLPTEIIAVQGSDDRTARAIYIGSVFVVSAATVALEIVVDRSPSLQRRPDVPRPKLAIRLVTPGLILIALALSMIPTIGLWSMLLLTLSGVIGKRMGDDEAVAAASP